MRLALGMSIAGSSAAATADLVAPVVTSSSYDGGTTTVSLNIVEASGSATCYWALVANPSTPTEAQVVAGTGGGILEAGSFTVTTGGDTDLIDMTGPGDEIHIVIKDAAGNSTGDPSGANNTVITGITFPYAENYVDNNGTAWLTATSGQFTANSQVEWAFRFKPQSIGVIRYLYESSGRIEITQYESRLRVIIKDTTNTTVYSLLTGTGVFSVGTEYFVYVGANSSTGAYDVKVNNATPSGTPSVSTTGANIAINSTTGLLALSSGSSIIDAQISEAFMGSGSNAGAAALWNGGTKANLATLAGYTPDIYFGNGMAATAWDSAANLGSATFTVGATGFTEV